MKRPSMNIADTDSSLTDAILTDLDHELKRASRLMGNLIVSSLHFGGGTPSLMPTALVSKIVNLIKSRVNIVPNLEIALEGNPSSLNEQNMNAFKSVGINRLSIGIQSVNNANLKFLGRDHSEMEAKQVLTTAYSVFSDPKDTVSFDLMFGLPNQSPDEWLSELRNIVNVVPPALFSHISLYQLTYEPGTPLWKFAKQAGIKFQSTPESAAQMYEDAVTFLHSGTKLKHYEVSNFAQPGHESSHNLGYWRGLDYIGVGPGAHGRITNIKRRIRTRLVKLPATNAYITQCKQIGHGTGSENSINQLDAIKELAVLSLRVKEGLDFCRAEEIALGADVKSVLDWSSVDLHCRNGFLEYSDDKQILRPTEKGLAVIDTILLHLIK